MSYKKYIEYKKSIKVEIDLNEYLDQLRDTIDKKVAEGSKLIDLICRDHIDSIVKESSYPRAEIVKIVIASKDAVKIDEQIERLKEWNRLKRSESSKKLLNILETIRVSYHIEPSEEDKNYIFDMHKEECRKKIGNIAQSVEDAIHKIKWRNHLIRVEAVPARGDLYPESAKVFINDQGSLIFELRNKDIRVLESYYSKECEKIKEVINQPRKNFISTFYLEGSFDKSRIDCIKREVALGLKSYLPEGTVLNKNGGMWKVKLNESDLIRYEDKYVVGEKETLIRHIEKNEKQH